MNYNFFVFSNRLRNEFSTPDDFFKITTTITLLSLRLSELMLNAPKDQSVLDLKGPKYYKKLFSAEYFATSHSGLMQSIDPRINENYASLITLVVNNKAIGYALILHNLEGRNDDVISLRYLAIEPEHQGCGFTKILLNKCIQEFNSKFVLINADKRLRDLYEKKLNFQYINECHSNPLEINMIYSVDGITDKDSFITMTKQNFHSIRMNDLDAIIDAHEKIKKKLTKNGKGVRKPVEIKSNIFNF